MNLNDLLKNINRWPNKFIKTALMDVRIVAGIGNIYSDEILHIANILPNKKVSLLSSIEFKNIYNEDDFITFCEELNNHLELIEMDLLAIDYINLHAAKYTNTKSAKNI
jgi:ribosomal protein S13